MNIVKWCPKCGAYMNSNTAGEWWCPVCGYRDLISFVTTSGGTSKLIYCHCCGKKIDETKEG